VVATRNRRQRLLDSLQRLTASGPDEVIVVDNGSSDGTAAAVRGAFPHVRVLQLATNRGSAARTVGARAARNDIVAFADDDSWWAPGALDRAVHHFARHPRLGLVAARVQVGEDDRLDPVSAEMARSPLPTPPWLPGPLVLGFVACGAVVRRAAYLGAGGFSDVLFFIGEERLLALDLAAAGWDLVYAADVVAHHHPAQPRPSVERRALVQRNDLLTLWLRRPAGRALLATARLACRAPHDAVARRALAGALRRLPQALAARRRLPPHVERALRLLEDTDRLPAAGLTEWLPRRRPRPLRPRHRRAADAAAQPLEEPFPITNEPIDAEALAGGDPSGGADPPSEVSVVEQAVHHVDQPCDVGVDEAVHAVVDDRGQLRRR
jgi:GT2 family glycosyltransferase